jgi:hypothetical protein
LTTIFAAFRKLDLCNVPDWHILSLHSDYVRSVWQSKKALVSQALFSSDDLNSAGPHQGDLDRADVSGSIGGPVELPVFINWEDTLLQAIGIGESYGFELYDSLGDWGSSMPAAPNDV